MAGSRYGVEVRAAQPADAPELARLLTEANIPVSAPEAALRLEASRASPGAVLVASGYPGLAGVVAVAWSPALDAAHPVAHIALLLVDAEERRRGIGRLLVKAASQAARSAGCDLLRVTGGEAFALAAGFIPAGTVFERSLRKRAAPKTE